MNWAMLSDLESEGGAAIAASRLADALIAAGHRVTRIVNTPDGRQHGWTTIQLPFAAYARAVRGFVLPRAGITMSGRLWQRVAGAIFCRNLQQVLSQLRPDIVNIHNLHSAFWAGWSDSLVDVALRSAPVMWTLHDMWSFTARCTYAYDCRKFLSGCDRTCPTASEYPALGSQQIAGAWRARSRLLSAARNLIAVTPSRWLAEEARRGLWKTSQIVVIPNGLPVSTYCAVDRNLARAALGVVAEGPVLLAAAQNLTERRKGGRALVEALARVSCRPITLMLLGGGSINLDIPGIKLHPLGYIDHERTRVLAYNAADIFVHPALVDNLPNVAAEAIACGTPVVGMPIGGVPEMVIPSRTGWLAQESSSTALGLAIDRALTELNSGITLRDSCVAFAASEYGSSVQAERYYDLARQAISHHA